MQTLGTVGPREHPHQKKKTSNNQGLLGNQVLPGLVPRVAYIGKNSALVFPSAVAPGCGGRTGSSAPSRADRKGGCNGCRLSKSVCRVGVGGDKHRGIYTYTRRKMGYMLGNILLFFYFIFMLLPFSHSGHPCCCIQQASKDARSRAGGGGSERPPKEAAAHCTQVPSGSSHLTFP